MMESDFDGAWCLFHEYAWDLLHQKPPASLRRLAREDRDDVIVQTIFFCWKDNRRALRGYTDIGKPFSGWLCLIANRLAHNEHARQRRVRALYVDDPDGTLINRVADTRPSPAEQRITADRLARLEARIAQMGALCRILLRGAGKGLKPQALARVLRYPPEEERNAADQLRECRRKLRELMRKQAVAEKAALLGWQPRTRVLCETSAKTNRSGKEGTR